MIYGEHAELLTERVRRQHALFLPSIPTTTKELKDVLNATRLDKNGKLLFDCSPGEHQVAVLLDNRGARFWIHYFGCGIGLVSLSFFSRLASAEGSLKNHTRERDARR